MTHGRGFTFTLVCVALSPAPAAAGQVCGTIAEFNAAMLDGGTYSTDVTLTFDVVGVDPNDFFGTKGSLAQFRNTTCATGADMGIKVYGPDDPPNDAHPAGTLKMEYGNSCCDAACGENWADPNPSAVVFVDGSEACTVTMWVNPADAGYSLACNNGQFDAVGGNPEANAVNEVNLLTFLLPDGGSTWPIANATASNDMVCWEQMATDMMSVTVPVLEDVTTGPSWPDVVFPDIADLAVESDGTTAYLKFDVPAIDGKITRTRLFMHSSTTPSSDGDGGEVHAVQDSAWSEGTMTWNTRPELDAASLGRIGPASAGVLVSVELATPLAGPGKASYAVFSPPSDGNGTHFWSKEGSAADAAYLKLDYVIVDGDGDGVNDGPDCDDGDAMINPGAQEVCNGVDDDCDGDTDEGCEADETGVGSVGEAGSDGEGDSGSSGGSDGTGGLTGISSAGLDGGPGFGEDDARGEDGCGCAASGGEGRGLLALAGFALVGRRRRRG